MSDFAQELLKAADEAVGNEPRCTVCALLRTVPDEEADALRVALSSKIGSKRLAAIIRKNGHPMSQTKVQEHRKEGPQ